MPAVEFICEDKGKCPIQDCITKGCRIPFAFDAGRCLSLATLRAISEQREWTGIPSTTMLIGGTREAYLKITQEFAIDPQDMIWAIHGTKVHALLEGFSEEDDICEERIFDEYSSGSPDRYERKTGYEYDYKSYGSFKTAKVLGLKKERVPVIGSDGKQEKWGNGKLKYFDRWYIGHKSRFDLALQMNDYRLKIERIKGLPVNGMFAEILTRDAGTYMAKSRGIEKNAQLVKINKISDFWVETYMRAKANNLKKALETDTLPPPCNYRETWGGIKCERFCQVWQFCDIGREKHKDDDGDETVS
jgi:hypothetical protein